MRATIESVYHIAMMFQHVGGAVLPTSAGDLREQTGPGRPECR